LTEDVIKDFNGVGAIKINNPTLLAMEVARKLPFVLSGREGDVFTMILKLIFLKKKKIKLFKP